MPNAREVLDVKRAGGIEELCLDRINVTTQSWSLMHTPRAGLFRFRFVRVACRPSQTCRPPLQAQHHFNDARRTDGALYTFLIRH